jgi:hypothetical protein
LQSRVSEIPVDNYVNRMRQLCEVAGLLGFSVCPHCARLLHVVLTFLPYAACLLSPAREKAVDVLGPSKYTKTLVRAL